MRPQSRRLSLALLLACLYLTCTPHAHAQYTVQNERHLIAYTSEFVGRSWATKKVLPTYPVEAVARNIQGVVETAVGLNNDGQVIKVRVPPGLDPHLRKAAVAAVKQWQFLEFANKLGEGEFGTFRLTFHFIIEEGTARVELYNPPRDSPAHARMRGASGRNRTEWLTWEDAMNDQ